MSELFSPKVDKETVEKWNRESRDESERIAFWMRQTLREKSAQILSEWASDVAMYEKKIDKLTKALELILPHTKELLKDYNDRYLGDDYSDDVAKKLKLTRQTLKELK